MYGLNVSDLSELKANGGQVVIQLLLCDFCTTDSPTAFVGKNLDDGIVLLDGPAAEDEERVMALLEFIQSVSKRRMGRRMRCYKRGPRGGWSKVRKGRQE